LNIQDENNTSYTSNRSHRIKQHHQSREELKRIDKETKEDTQIYHIPTLLNGIIRNTSKETVSSVGTCRTRVVKNKSLRHKLTMIGDSFLRGIRENVELLLSDRSGTCSMVKPGCELNTLLESAKSAIGGLTHKDAILICEGSSD
jgi:hypothetical protein